MSNVNVKSALGLLAVAGLSLASPALATPETPSGASADYVGNGMPNAGLGGVALDAFAAPGPRAVLPFLPDDAEQAPVDAGPASFLHRSGRVQLEPNTPLTKEQEALEAQIDAAWSDGDFTTGEALIAQLNETGFDGAVTVSYTGDDDQATVGKMLDVYNPDRRISSTRANPSHYDLDAVTQQRLFAVVNWDNTWTVNISNNQGSSWIETFTFGAAADDVDMAFVDGWVYVGYLTGGQVRMRRFDAATGSVDNTYFFQTLFTGAGAELPLLEIAVEGNEDSFQNRIFCQALKSNGTFYFGWDESSDGTTFTSINVPESNAAGSLDLHWNELADTYFLYSSYRDASGNVRVGRANTFLTWTVSSVTSTTTSSPDVSISAYDDAVIVAYENNSNDPFYHISYNGGDSYIISGDIFPDANYSRNDVSAALGYGTAMVAGVEVGEPDIVRVRQRDGYAPGAWTEGTDINEQDISTGTAVKIEAVPAPAGFTNYGVLYSSGDALWFDRVVTTCEGDIADDFGNLGPDGMVSFGDFLAMLGLVGSCPGQTIGCAGDIADDFGTLNAGDGQVSFGDFLALLGLVGACP